MDEFICPSQISSIKVTCDKAKCPLQGSPIAPLKSAQLIAGEWNIWNVFWKNWSYTQNRNEIDFSGQVVVGGDEGNYISHVEIFPPPSPDACYIPNLPHPRYGHSLSLLPGGVLLVCGGIYDFKTVKSCISWVFGNASWTVLHSLR